MKKYLRNKWVVSLGIALTTALLLLFLSYMPFFENLELKTVDARFRMRGTVAMPDTDIVIVAIDDESFASVPGKWPYPRTYFAKAVENLAEAGARLIIFDVEFTEATIDNPEEDQMLAEAVAAAQNVILATKIVYDRKSHGMGIPWLMKPIPPLLRTGVPLALINYDHDADGFIRRYLLFNQAQGETMFSLAVRALQMLEGVNPAEVDIAQPDILGIGGREIQKLGMNNMYINFIGPAGTIPTYSLANVLDDAEFDLADESDTDYMELFKGGFDDPEFASLLGESPFQDKIVFIGASAEELGDNKLTPFLQYEGTQQKMPGVEMHANALSTMLRGDYISFPSLGYTFLLLLVVSALTGIICRTFKPLLALAAVLVLIIALCVFGQIAFINQRLLVPLISPLVAMLASYFGNIAHLVVTERREKKLYRETFQQYVARSVVDKMLDSGELPKFGGERKNLTVLFSDIRKFSTFAERNRPEEVVRRLSEYFTRMVDIIFNYNGTLDKFVGDEIMAIYGAPYYFKNHAERACLTALEMIAQLRKLQKHWADINKDYFQIGIGINTGPMIVGNLGSAQLFDYTVIGDHVNLGARLEGANKLYSTSIIISENTYREVKDRAIVRELDIVRVLGKEKPVRIYELLGMDALPQIEKDFIVEAYTKGLSAYREKRWYQGLKEFRRVLRYFPTDGPSVLYTKRCMDYIESPPPDDWTAVYDFDTK